MNETQTVKYTVAARFVPRIQSLVDKVAKRCKRLRIPAPVLAITGSETRGTYAKVNGQEIYREAVFNHVTLTGPAQPKLAGWEFAATLEHDLETKLTVLRTSQAFGRELPLHFRKSEPICEHCGFKRVRKDTYVVYNAETNTFKQVGHTCIRDFLGLQNVDAAINIVAMWQDIEAILDGDYESEGSDWREWSNAMTQGPVVDLTLFLDRTVAIVRTFGFVSRKAVQAQMDSEDNMSDEEASRQIRLEATRDRVLDHLFPPRKISNKLRDDILLCEPTDADKAKAQAALAWIRAHDADKLNDYMFNLFAAAANDIMPFRRAGLVASLVSAYNRHIEFEDKRVRDAKARAEKFASCKHVGTVGERLRDLTLNVVRVIPREGQFGVTYITALEDDKGNQFTWFASGTELEVGLTYSVTGTVKSHGEFRGTPQTVLTRCKCKEAATEAPATAQDGAGIVLTPQAV